MAMAVVRKTGKSPPPTPHPTVAAVERAVESLQNQWKDSEHVLRVQFDIFV